MPVLHYCISSFEGTPNKKLQDIATSSCSTSAYTSADIIFYKF